MGSDDWKNLGKLGCKLMAGAIGVGMCVGGIVGTLLLWLEGLEGGDL